MKEAGYDESAFKPAYRCPLCEDTGFKEMCIRDRLYADFSGYTDIVLGLGEVLGLELPENLSLIHICQGEL